MPPSAPKREYASVPDHDQTLVSIETDKEYPQSSVVLLWMKPRDSVHTVGDFRRTLISQFYDAMLNARFNEMAQRADAPFRVRLGRPRGVRADEGRVPAVRRRESERLREGRGGAARRSGARPAVRLHAGRT